VGEGAARPARAGVDGEAGGLVQDGDVRVFLEDAEVSLLGEDPLLLRLGRPAVDPVPGGERRGSLGFPSVDEDVAVADPALDLVAGDVEAGGDLAVEALAGLFGGDFPGVGQPASSCSRCRCGRKLSMAMRTMPIEMALSATLKEGQCQVPT
jgi:hypothetical protein